MGDQNADNFAGIVYGWSLSQIAHSAQAHVRVFILSPPPSIPSSRQRNFPRTAKYVRTPHLPLGRLAALPRDTDATVGERDGLMQRFRQTRTCPPGQDLDLENLSDVII